MSETRLYHTCGCGVILDGDGTFRVDGGPLAGTRIDTCPRCGVRLDVADLNDRQILSDSTVMGTLELAATTLAEQRDPDEWPGWIVYILEALQDKADATEYTDFLERVRDSITTRLDSGQW